MGQWEWQVQHTVEVRGLYIKQDFRTTDKTGDLRTLVTFSEIEDSPAYLVTMTSFYLKESTKEEVIKLARNAANDIINVLVDKYHISFKNFKRTYLEDKSGRVNVTGEITLYNEDVIVLNEEEVIELMDTFQDEVYLNYLGSTSEQAIFRDIISSKNKVGNYISMYGLLDAIIPGKGQERIDNFIKNYQSYYNPSEDMDSSKKDKSGNSVRRETKYTWLRNQIGHVQLTTDIMDVEIKMEEAYPALTRLVQEAMNVYLR